MPYKMVQTTSSVTLGTSYTTIVSTSFTGPPNNLFQNGVLRWNGIFEVTAPTTPSAITYEFVVGVGSLPSCSSGTFTGTGNIPASALKAGTQDVPIAGWIGPNSGVNFYATTLYITVCAEVASTSSGSTVISHPTIIGRPNIGSAWLMDLTSYPTSATFSGNNPGIVSCYILNTSATPISLPEDGSWVELTPTNNPACNQGKFSFAYDPKHMVGTTAVGDAEILMRGGMMKVSYPCTGSGCTGGTLEYVEYTLLASTSSSALCTSSNLLSLNIDRHGIDGAEIGQNSTAQPLINVLAFGNDPGTNPVYIRLCAHACLSTDGGVTCRSTGGSDPVPQVSWDSAQVDLLTKPY
jgi:hypothetical protein